MDDDDDNNGARPERKRVKTNPSIQTRETCMYTAPSSPLPSTELDSVARSLHIKTRAGSLGFGLCGR